MYIVLWYFYSWYIYVDILDFIGQLHLGPYQVHLYSPRLNLRQCFEGSQRFLILKLRPSAEALRYHEAKKNANSAGKKKCLDHLAISCPISPEAYQLSANLRRPGDLGAVRSKAKIWRHELALCYSWKPQCRSDFINPSLLILTPPINKHLR